MKLKLRPGGVLAIAVLTCLLTNPARADPKGLWRGADGGTTRIAACGDGLCGYLVTIVPPKDPATGKPWTDKHNPSADRQSRPLAGVMVLIGLRPSTPGTWAGRLYNYQDGGTYDGHIIEQGPNNLRIEGCALGICGGANMARAR
jgi:uncharacterized protein (DUF2147 family)